MTMISTPAKTAVAAKRRAAYCCTRPVCDLAEALAAALGGGARAVDDGVDDALVDLVVDELAGLHATWAGAVDHAVDDLLVEPVGGAWRSGP